MQLPKLGLRLRDQYASEAERTAGVFAVDLVGRACISVVVEPERWTRDWGTTADSLQHLKQMWHHLVRFGAEAESATDGFASQP